MHETEQTRYLERLRALIRSGESFDLRRVVAGAGPEDEEALAVAVREYGRFRRLEGEVVEIEEFRLALPWLYESDAVLGAAVEAVLESTLLLGRDHLAAGRSISRAHPLAATAVGRAMERFRNGGSEAEGVSVPLPRDFGPEGVDGEPRYRLLATVGSGPNGTVYEAVDREAYTSEGSPTVAVKMLRRRSDQAGMMDRFAAELERLRRAGGGAVVPLIDAGVAPSGEAYLVYRLVRGDRLRRDALEGRAAAREAVRRTLGVARGIEPLHAMGVAHGWLKPTNVIVTRTGELALTDLGLGLLRPEPLDTHGRYTEKAGLAFVAPEVLSDGGLPTPAADLYGLGTLLYWLLTGRLPNGEHAQQAHGLLMDRVPVERSFPSWVGAELRAVCLGAMSSDPRSRPCSVTAWCDQLERWLAGRPLPGITGGWAARRKLARSAAPVTAALLLGAGAAFVGTHQWTERRWDQRSESLRSEFQIASATAAAQRDAAEAWAEQTAANARETLERAERMEARTQQRIDTVHRSIGEWAESIIRSISDKTGMPIALLEVVSRFPLIRPEDTENLLPMAAQSARINADRTADEKTMESVVWQTLAALKLYEVRHPACVVYIERARDLITELKGPDDPWATALGEMLKRTEAWPLPPREPSPREPVPREPSPREPAPRERPDPASD
ncbi:MAG: serine/threonine protein kinase [Phycisphaerales bacterium]|nr:serine/threonine protein kinase [Planctomycetota bacterium]MCH8509901.1 serine/threonine protein kinase [Phycisphaerales bacterium]